MRSLLSEILSFPLKVQVGEYPHRGDYEDQVVATLGERGLIVYSFAKKADNGKRYFKTEYLSTELKPLFTDSKIGRAHV